MGVIKRQGIKNTITGYLGIVIGFVNLILIQPHFLTKRKNWGLPGSCIRFADRRHVCPDGHQHNAIIGTSRPSRMNSEAPWFLRIRQLVSHCWAFCWQAPSFGSSATFPEPIPAGVAAFSGVLRLGVPR